MPRVILDTCIACGTCKENCPVDCIAEGDIYVIDQDACIDCGVCEANCPVDCIVIAD
ncbi:MAG: 4Fe-4S binding protein [Candidatus Izemoplasmatales bacterium]|jgi:NAD-dependent dihydropyrimidine dehydrogenase PreA subunit|nr:4Fe-4S binding protein [Candidatus Izemoplasmatales bacterium]